MTAPAAAEPGGTGNVLRRARFDARMALGRQPVAHQLITLWNWGRVRETQALVTGRTQLVMDGFPSSGNSFAIAALKVACQAESTALPRVAHHLHNPGQVRAAVRRGLPTLLLVRDPRATTASALTRWPALTAEQILRNYVGYYERLRGCWPGVVVAELDQVTSDFGEVTRRVNERFGCRFPEFDHTQDNEGLVYDRDAAGRATRRTAATARRSELDGAGLGRLVEAAISLHQELAALAGWQRPQP